MKSSKKDFREQATRGTERYPFQIYEMSYQGFPELEGQTRCIIPYHWHPDLELLLVRQGTIQVTIESHHYEGREGDLIFINTEHLHTITAPSHTDTVYSAIVFEPGFLDFPVFDYVQGAFLAPIWNGELLFPTHLSDIVHTHPVIYEQLCRVLACNRQKTSAYQLETKIGLLSCILYFFQNQMFVRQSSSKAGISDSRTQLMKQILSYVQANYHRKLSLEEISMEFHLSPKYFSRFFRQQFGQTFTSYLNAYRIERACHLLETTEQSILDIAMDTGFDNSSYFVKVFQGITHVSPGKYRKICQKKTAFQAFERE